MMAGDSRRGKGYEGSWEPSRELKHKAMTGQGSSLFQMRLTIGLALFVYNKDLLFVL